MVYLGGVFTTFLGIGVDTRVFICQKVWDLTGTQDDFYHHWWEQFLVQEENTNRM